MHELCNTTFSTRLCMCECHEEDFI
jgi:hypothetical protein